MMFQPDYAGVTAVVPSPNLWLGRQGHAITGIVMHGTAGGGAVSWFSQTQSQVSAHYVIDTDGRITQCVREDDTAWHAGVVTPNSIYATAGNMNFTTIGIEHVRDTTNTSALTHAQQAASIALVTNIRERRGHLPLIPHDAIDVGRVCPGPGFPLTTIDASAKAASHPPEVAPMTTLDIAPVNQNANRPGDADNAQDQGERGLDCGEGCVVGAVKWATGRDLTVDEVHDALMKPGVDAYSYVGPLSAYLNKQGVATHYTNLADESVARQEALNHIAGGKPVICLLFWDRAAQTGGHFVLGKGGDGAGGVIENNPWGGWVETLIPAAWRQAYNGWLIFIDSPAHAGAAPTPPASSSSSNGSPGAPGGATSGPLRFRVLFDGALHAKPNQAAPITRHIKKDDVLTAQASDSAPWISLKLPDGTWGGWDLRSNLQRL